MEENVIHDDLIMVTHQPCDVSDGVFSALILNNLGHKICLEMTSIGFSMFKKNESKC